MTTTRKKGEDARHEDAVPRASTGRGESGNRPGVDEKPSGVTEEEAGRAKDGKAGLQEAGLSSVGRSDPRGMTAARRDRKAVFERIEAIPENERTQDQRDELQRTHDAEVNDILAENADDEEAKLTALGIPEEAPVASTGYIEVDDRDSSGNKRRTWFWKGHRHRGEVVQDQEKGPNGELRYFLQRQGANVGAPMPFNVAIGQLVQDTEQRPA